MNNILGFEGTLDEFFDAAVSGKIDLEFKIAKMKKILKKIKKEQEDLQRNRRDLQLLDLF